MRRGETKAAVTVVMKTNVKGKRGRGRPAKKADGVGDVCESRRVEGFSRDGRRPIPNS